MTNSIDFNSIQGTSGGYASDMELVLRTNSKSTIKKMLTMRNGQIAWRVKFLKKKLDYWKGLIAASGESGIYVQSPSLVSEGLSRINKRVAEAHRKIPEIEREIDELTPQISEELFTEVDGKLVVPPGLWYLCESIHNNAHLNEDLLPFFLPQLRPYQKEALVELYKYKRSMIELATGLGKSFCIQSIAMAAVQSGKRCMIVVPTEYLVGQMLSEMKKLHTNTTAQGGGRIANGGWDVLVTTIQSAGGFADLPDVAIIDEGHHISANSWTSLAISLSKATHVYGFTATAFRSDGLDMAIHSFLGPIVYSRDVRWGIQNGYLNSFSPIMITVNPKKNGRKLHLPEDRVQTTTAYKALIGSYETMSIVKDRLMACVSKDRKVIVVFKTVQACKDFRKFCTGTIDLDVASAEKGNKTKAPMRRFQNGDSRVLLVNSGLISEGVNISDCDAIIQVCQNSSDVMTLQILGRMLRKSPDKKQSVIFDITTNGYETFVRAGKRRQKLYEQIVGQDSVKIIAME